MIARSVDALYARPRAVAAALLCTVVLCAAAGLTQAQQTPATALWVHAYAAFGEPKYPRDFTHFDYKWLRQMEALQKRFAGAGRK